MQEVTGMSQKKPLISVVGGGLAGTELALQLAHQGFPVDLYEMRPHKMTPAHKTGDLAELVCSNSFGSLALNSPPGMLKNEAELLGSFILKAAKLAAVPAGQALGIDRQIFAQTLTKWVNEHPLIHRQDTEVTSLQDLPRPAVIATGPLTTQSLSESLQKHFGEKFLYFFDAIAPVIDADSIDRSIVWAADRYDKGSPDYLNCPLTKEQYFHFISEVKNARKIEPKEFETTPFFEGCMPIEVMIDRGPQTLRFGPMKPVGLTDPRTGKPAYAVVQLRAENKDLTSYNMVGFQTRMAYGEQQRVFKLIPGLENAIFHKLGSIHRNLFVNSPTVLTKDLSSKRDNELFFAGQITGVEGYFESTCTGLMVAKFITDRFENRRYSPPPRESALGSLLNAITDPERAQHFQPTNINWGLFPKLEDELIKKDQKREEMIKRADLSFRNAFATTPINERALTL